MTALRSLFLPAAWAGILALGALPATGQEGFEFMPDGGKTLMLDIYEGQPDAQDRLAKIAAAKRSAEEWLSFIEGVQAELTGEQKQTLADYLELNVPLAEGAFEEAVKAEDVASAFPPDGKELSVLNCQFCHSIFSGYLMQDRDLQGWRNVFVSPFHKEIDMDETERETFSRYSATNMPMKYDEVPPELRF